MNRIQFSCNVTQSMFAKILRDCHSDSNVESKMLARNAKKMFKPFSST